MHNLQNQFPGDMGQIFASMHQQIGLFDNDFELLQSFGLNQVSVCAFFIFLRHLTK